VRFSVKLESKHGSLENATAARHTRGLKQWIGWRIRDLLREERGRRDWRERVWRGKPLMIEEVAALPFEEARRFETAARARQKRAQSARDRVWQRAHTAAPPLSETQTRVLGFVLDGLSNRAIAEQMDWHRTSEGHVRRLVGALIRRRILTPRWRCLATRLRFSENGDRGRTQNKRTKKRVKGRELDI
jgi:hypothetical protein